MKRFVLLALPMAAAVLLLFLNLYERDLHPNAMTHPPEGPINVPPPDWLPETVSHPCPDCTSCKHRLTVKESHRVLSVQDRDGWYRLFWAGDDTYYHEDPSFFGASLQNHTAHSPAGTWTLELEYTSPLHNHPCGTPPHTGRSLVYELVPEFLPTEKEDGIPKQIHWISFQIDPMDQLSIQPFSWRRTADHPYSRPCPCGEPRQ